MDPDETVEHASIYTLPHAPLAPGDTTRKLPRARGIALLNLRVVEDGRRDLERFLQLAPDHPQALDVRRILEETAR